MLDLIAARPGLAALLYALCYVPFVWLASGAYADPTAECCACFLFTALLWWRSGLFDRAKWSMMAVASGVCSALVVMSQLVTYRYGGDQLPALVCAQRTGVLGLGLFLGAVQHGHTPKRAELLALVLAVLACLCAALARWHGPPVLTVAWAGTGLYLMGYLGKLWGAGLRAKRSTPKEAVGYLAAEQLVASCTAAMVMLWLAIKSGQGVSLSGHAWLAGVGASMVGLTGALLLCSPAKPHAWSVALNRVAGLLAVYVVSFATGKPLTLWDAGAVACAVACAWACSRS